jgi:hypothetical protein
VLRAGLLLHLVRLLGPHHGFDVQREALFAVANLAAPWAAAAAPPPPPPPSEVASTAQVVAAAVEGGALPACARLLASAADPAVLGACLALLGACLTWGPAPANARAFEACGGLEALDALHYNTTLEPALQAHAAALVDAHFGDDYEEGSEDETGDAEGSGSFGGGAGFGGGAAGFGGLGFCGAGVGGGPTAFAAASPPPAAAGRGRQMTLPAWMVTAQAPGLGPGP